MAAVVAQPAQDASNDPFAILRMVEPNRETSFQENGFIVLEQGLKVSTCELLCERLEAVLRGTYDSGSPPDKAPKFTSDLRVKVGKTPPPLGGPSKRTLQVINVWKCDCAFREVVCSPLLGELVAKLGGWPSGARIANDQVWAKPPGAAALTYHRDSGYFDMTPPGQVITVWIALDDCDDPNVGPLEYAPGSHRWADATGEGTGTLRGAPAQFFGLKSHMWPMLEAFKRENHSHASEEEPPPNVVPVSVRRGGIGIHDGRTWHGSAQNNSSRPRRGLGIHFVPACSSLRDPNGRTHAHRFRTCKQQQPQQQKTVPPSQHEPVALSSMGIAQPNTDEQSTAFSNQGTSRRAPEVNAAALNPPVEETGTETSSRELNHELRKKLNLGDTNSITSTIKTAAMKAEEVDSPNDPCYLPEEYFPITFRGKSGS